MFKLAPKLADSVDKTNVIAKVAAEGIPVSVGYVSLHLNKAVLNEIERWTGSQPSYSCPISEKLSSKQAIWVHQNALLAEEAVMHDIAASVKKVVQSLE